MSSAWIRRREHPPSQKHPRGSRTYIVLYRRGGRGYPSLTAGSFRSEKDAKTRKDLVSGWLAAGLDPRVELAKLAALEAAPVTLREGIRAFNATRIDANPAYQDVIRAATEKLVKPLGKRLPSTITVADLQLVVADLELAPSTTRMYVGHWRTLFDFLQCDPNPAKSRHLRLPAVVREEVSPPTAEAFLAAVSRVGPKFRLPLVVAEQTGMRIGEIESLEWGDVDETGLRFRLRAGATKTRRARWVQVPEWLMPHISATCAVEDRASSRRVFTFNAKAARNALQTACAAAGVPHFSPHDLRHRRATIWHHEGLPIKVQMERGGWTRSEIPIEVYSFAQALAEVPVKSLEEVLA